MGNPRNYSLALPERCLLLLDSLWLHAQNVFDNGRPDLGPLTSTFLISMSMPIINLPIERVERRRNASDSYANDRPLNPDVASAVDQVLGKGKLGDAPFFEAGAWSFTSYSKSPLPNIADGIPEEIGKKLDSIAAVVDAKEMPAAQWVSILRNALAHGGVAYLDAEGRSSYDRPVKMYAFVSGRYDKEKREFPRLVAVNFLRISETGYHNFLRLWVRWLFDTGIARASEAA